MSSQTERWLLAIVAAASVVMAATLVHREFFAPAPAVGTAARLPPATYVAEWKQALPFSIRDGVSTAPVTLVVLSDLECPACAGFSRTLDRMRQHHPADVSVAFVHWPLTSIHRFALPAARAAECADAAGRFNAFAKLVYGKRDSIGLKSWASYAADAGVSDTITFARCMRTTNTARIDSGTAFATRIGAIGTPAVLVNGWLLSHVPSEAELEGALANVKRGSAPFGDK